MQAQGLDPVAWCVFVEFCSSNESNEEILGVEMMFRSFGLSVTGTT